jgi:hypothetical protein
MILDRDGERTYRSVMVHRNTSLYMAYICIDNTIDYVPVGEEGLTYLPDNYQLGECLLELD